MKKKCSPNKDYLSYHRWLKNKYGCQMWLFLQKYVKENLSGYL